MVRPPARPCATLLLIALFASASLRAQGPGAAEAPAHTVRDSTADLRAASEWRWAGVESRGKMLAFDLVRGSIRIERSRTPEVEVIARRHAVRSDPMSVTMRVDTTAEGLSFIASHPPMPPLSAGSRHDCLPPEDDRGDFWHSDVRVELLVRVPDGVRVLARVMSGDIDVAPVAAELDLTTNTGAVRIADPEGGVRASTGSGDVELRLASPATRLARGAIRLEAYYGSVRLVAAGDAPRSLRWTGARGGGVSGRLAPGGRALSAEAVHGTVSWDIARD